MVPGTVVANGLGVPWQLPGQTRSAARSTRMGGFNAPNVGNDYRMFKFIRRIIRPISRTMLLVLAWNHREAVALWVRTLVAELRDRRRADPSRLRRLGRALTRVSNATSRRDLAGLRRLRLVDPDTIVVEGDGVGVDIAMTALGGSIRHVHAA